jgi:uncharacterized protein (TIGR02147 family)
MDIYQYDDFRLFLKERYHEKMLETPGYSYRKFAREAGFANPGYLNDVIKGFKPLSENAAERMGKAFQLKAHETEFLKLLSAFGQAKTAEKKSAFYRQILARRNRSRFTRLNPALSRYYQDYRYGLVRGAIEVLDFRGDYDELSVFLDPPVPVALVKKIVRDLCEWRLVEQGPDGRYRTTPSVVEPAPNLMGMSRQINAEWLAQAKEALHRLPREKRHVSTMILNISDALAREIAEMIERFREEVFKKVEADAKPQRIVQLSLAYIPKSKVKG